MKSIINTKLNILATEGSYHLKKKVIALSLVVILASVVFAYFSETSILYQDIPYQYQKIGGKWFTFDRINNSTIAGTYTTIHCQNKGLLDGTFNIIIKLTNAAFNDSNPQSKLVNGNTIKVTYVLRGQEGASTNLYFMVDPNATKFEVSIAIETSQLFLRSDIPGMYGQATFPYSMTSNNTWSATEIWSPAMIA